MQSSHSASVGGGHSRVPQTPEDLARRIDELTANERTDGCNFAHTVDEWKALGNECVARCEHFAAIRCYTKGLELLDKEFGRAAGGDLASGELPATTEDVFRSNRSAAYVQSTLIAGPSLALKDAEKVIALRPGWFKGFIRKGDALQAKRKFAEAINAYESALLLEPSCRAARAGIDACKAAADAPQDSHAAHDSRPIAPATHLTPPTTAEDRSVPVHHTGSLGQRVAEDIARSNKAFETGSQAAATDHGVAMSGYYSPGCEADGDADSVDMLMRSVLGQHEAHAAAPTKSLNSTASRAEMEGAFFGDTMSLSSVQTEKTSSSSRNRVDEWNNAGLEWSGETVRGRSGGFGRRGHRNDADSSGYAEGEDAAAHGPFFSTYPAAGHSMPQPSVLSDADREAAAQYKASLMESYRLKVSRNAKLREEIQRHTEAELLKGDGINYRQADKYRGIKARGTDGVGLGITADSYKSYVGMDKPW